MHFFSIRHRNDIIQLHPGKACPVVLSLVLEEAEEDGAHQLFTCTYSAVSGPAWGWRKGTIPEITTDLTGLLPKRASPIRLPERLDTSIIRGFWRWRGFSRDPRGPVSRGYGTKEKNVKCIGQSGGCWRKNYVRCNCSTRTVKRQGHLEQVHWPGSQGSHECRWPRPAKTWWRSH